MGGEYRCGGSLVFLMELVIASYCSLVAPCRCHSFTALDNRLNFMSSSFVSLLNDLRARLRDRVSRSFLPAWIN
uniref:Putative secreted protein n=1 Tax=Anopheles triannulatus TaxID=58253 RepID=A0A2M4B7J8_9DIPT